VASLDDPTGLITKATRRAERHAGHGQQKTWNQRLVESQKAERAKQTQAAAQKAGQKIFDALKARAQAARQPARAEPTQRPQQAQAPRRPEAASRNWWQSPSVPPASAEDQADNARAVRTLTGLATDGEHPRWIAEDIAQGYPGADAKLADLVNQLEKAEPGRGRRYADDVMGRLGEQDRQRLTAFGMDNVGNTRNPASPVTDVEGTYPQSSEIVSPRAARRRVRPMPARSRR
jgi:hypothetical protein